MSKSEAFRFQKEDKDEKLPWFLIKYDSTVKKTWDMIMAAMLIYTASFMPFRVSFMSTIYWDF